MTDNQQAPAENTEKKQRLDAKYVEKQRLNAEHTVNRTYGSAWAFDPVWTEDGALMGFTYADRRDLRGRRYGWVTLEGQYTQAPEEYRAIAKEMLAVVYREAADLVERQNDQ